MFLKPELEGISSSGLSPPKMFSNTYNAAIASPITSQEVVVELAL